MKDDELYGPVIVRRRHNGIEVREQKLGSNILVKNQFAAVPGTFLISKRQIIHGSSGIVPNDIGDNAIISKEYIAFDATDKLDIRYLKYFAKTPIFHKSIVKTTYGVDDEKFVFKDIWWLKEKLPLPPIDEQNKICDILDSNKNFMACEEKRLERLLAVKKGLMQDLLTGHVRVKLDEVNTT